jgi:hypothetical protein
VIRRDWSEAEVKRTSECRVCGRSDYPIELAHIIGREHDKKEPLRSLGRMWKSATGQTLYVHPDRVIGACGFYEDSCHKRYDAHLLSLAGHLTPEEEAQAVVDAGSLELARKRIDPLAYEGKVATSGVGWPE